MADGAFPTLTFAALGYEVAHHGDGRWNGVAILSRVGLDDVTEGFGGALSGESVQFRRLLMGVCFGGALTIVIFAGSELFTGSNLVLTLGVLKRRARVRDLLSNWFWTYLGNLAGAVLLAVLPMVLVKTARYL